MSELHKKLKDAFLSIDVSQDGSIDWLELQDCCKKIQITLDEADKVDFESFQQSNLKQKASSTTNTQADKQGLNFGEFSDFVRRRLERTFRAVDTNGNGYIDSDEIKEVLQKVGVKINSRQVDAILKLMDTDGDKLVSFEEFCAFFADVPTPNMQFIAKLWSSGEGLDFGSDVVPLSIPPVEMPLYQFMMAGGVAGIASRSLTAPLEKLKIVAQVCL